MEYPEKLDRVLIRQKDYLLRQLNSLESSFDLDKALSFRRQLELVRELWVEFDYEYKLNEILIRFNNILSKKTSRHPEIPTTFSLKNRDLSEPF